MFLKYDCAKLELLHLLTHGLVMILHVDYNIFAASYFLLV
uniref:Uncharacterized protein n=1 Tax=Rhizophora mucronata TaxID=61149 RepID=A0A2P2NU87_RHIMU